MVLQNHPRVRRQPDTHVPARRMVRARASAAASSDARGARKVQGFEQVARGSRFVQTMQKLRSTWPSIFQEHTGVSKTRGKQPSPAKRKRMRLFQNIPAAEEQAVSCRDSSSSSPSSHISSDVMKETSSPKESKEEEKPEEKLPPETAAC